MSRTLFTDTCCKIHLRPYLEIPEDVQESVNPNYQIVFRWESPELNTLLLESGSFFESEPFTFDGSLWQIRTYPNGLSENEYYGIICLVLERISSHAPRYHGRLTWKFGIQKNGGEQRFMTVKTTQQNDLKLRPFELVPLTEVFNAGSDFLHHSKITMFCQIQYCGTPAPVVQTDELMLDYKYSIAVINPQNRFDDNMEGDANAEAKTSSVLEILWELPDITEMPLTVGYYVTSRAFLFEDRTYRLRLYPNGQSEDESEGLICLLLTIYSDPLDIVRRIKCKIGLKEGEFQISEEHGLKGSERLLGPIKFWHRSEVKAPIEVFCTISTDKKEIL